MFFQRIKVNSTSRVLLIKNERLLRILEPGSHIVFLSPFADWRMEHHRVHDPMFRSRWSDQILRERSDALRRHFHIVETRDSELAMISLDGSLYQVLLPSRRAVFWRNAGKVNVEFVSLIEEPDETGDVFGSIALPEARNDGQLLPLDDSSSALIERDTGSNLPDGNL